MKSVHFTQLMRRINEIELLLLTSATSIVYSSQWGSAGTGNGEFAAASVSPYGVVAHNGEIYLSDRGSNDRIQVFDVNGNFVRKWGSSGTGTSHLNDPSGMHIYNNEVYVAEVQNNRMHVFDLNGTHRTMWGSLGSGDGQFNAPEDLFVYNDEVYVVDHNNARIQVFDTNGNFIRKWSGSGAGVLADPTGIHVDTNGEVFVCEDINHRVVVYDTVGNYVREFGTFGTSDGQLDNPTGVRIYGSTAYVVDSDNNRVQAFDKDTGSFISKIGTPGSGNEQFNVPTMCTIYGGKLYVCDGGNRRVQVFALGAGDQTEFHHLLKDGTEISLGTPDGGVNVPAVNAIYHGVSGSETQRVRVPGTYILQCRAAIERLVAVGVIENPKTGNPFNRDDGDITDNVHYIAMNSLMRDYGLAGETLYSWARPIQTDFADYYDVDIGELWRVVEVLYDSARQQGLI